MRRLVIHLYLVIAIAFIFLNSPVLATASDVMSLLTKMKEVRETAFESARKLEIIVKSGDEVTSEILAGYAQKKLPSGKNILIVLLKPESVSGMAYLFRERNDMSIDQWIYPPVIKRVRKITSSWNTYESFFNTDFTYADLGFLDIRGEHRLLGEEKIGDIPVYKIQTIPQLDLRYYSRILTWISKETYLPIRRDFYDPANRLWKREELGQVTIINEVPVPHRISMTDLQLGRSTHILVSEVRTDLKLPDEIFTPDRLQYSSQCPIWESVCEVKIKKQ